MGNHIKNVAENEYMYAGASKQDSDRRYVLTYVPRKGYVVDDETYQWRIEPVPGTTDTYHIKNVGQNEYMYAGYFKQSSDRRLALTFVPRKGTFNSETTYQWTIVKCSESASLAEANTASLLTA